MMPDTQGGAVPAPHHFRILLVDDHALFLQSLKTLLETKGYEVVGAAGNGMEALKQARLLHPDLILMDIEMPVCDGLAATQLIKAEMPHVQIVMLTVSAADEHLFEAVKNGATGYLLKSQSANQFLDLVAQAENGGAALPPDLARRVLDEFARQARHPTRTPEEMPDRLSARQLEILTLVARGLTYPQVGEILHLSEPTVRYHMAQILEKLHLQNRAQVIAYAAKHGL